MVLVFGYPALIVLGFWSLVSCPSFSFGLFFRRIHCGRCCGILAFIYSVLFGFHLVENGIGDTKLVMFGFTVTLYIFVRHIL